MCVAGKEGERPSEAEGRDPVENLHTAIAKLGTNLNQIGFGLSHALPYAMCIDWDTAWLSKCALHVASVHQMLQVDHIKVLSMCV